MGLFDFSHFKDENKYVSFQANRFDSIVFRMMCRLVQYYDVLHFANNGPPNDNRSKQNHITQSTRKIPMGSNRKPANNVR